VATPVLEGLVLAGAFDELYGIVDAPMLRRGRITRRDLLLSVADLERADRVDRRGGRARGLRAAHDRSAEVQLPLDLAGPADVGDVVATGLPELTATERLAAELDIIGLDASRHVLSGHLDFLAALGVTFSCDLLTRRSRKDVLIAGVKVATQTPPIRSGRRVVFLTLDDTTGPADATFFEDVQGPYAATVFNSWQLVVRGELRRAGPRGVSVRATGCWELTHLHGLFTQALAETGSETEAIECVRAAMDVVPDGFGVGDADGRRPVLVHASGFRQSPYADVKPAGGSVAAAPRKLWHSSPGSAGR
jgi:error-prone DNA polymerase